MTCEPLLSTSRRTSPGGSVRRARTRWCKAVLLCAAVQLLAPTPAHAWFAWLDQLSGPGPFWGAEFDYRIVCFVEVPPWTDAAMASQAAGSILHHRAQAMMALSDVIMTSSEARADQIRIQDFESLDHWTGVIANAAHRESAMLEQASLLTRLEQRLRENQNLKEPEVVSALNRAASLWRSATQPRVAFLPGSVVWASCSDHPKNDRVPKALQPMVLHGDRKPTPSIVVNYRQVYSNWQQSTETPFAPGNKIVLRVLEPKFTWPLSGRFDFLDGQAGIGRYWFSSDGFDTFSGWIVEPIRFDLHWPARFADGKGWWARGLLAVSYSAGVVLFPAGFPPNAFNRAGSTPPIPGGEAIFEQGIVVNVGRIFSR